MDGADVVQDAGDRLAALLRGLEIDAERLDRDATLPPELAPALHRNGLLAAPCPRALGGEGLGTEPDAAQSACALLRAMGRAWMPLGRVFEGHVNALRLIALYGNAAQARQAAADARAGHLFAIWAAENPAEPVRLRDGALTGRKTFASGAGAVTRALVTAQADGEILVLVAVPPSPARILARPDLHGMRGAGTAAVDLTAIAVPSDCIIGQPGDYMRQPEISLGAWRPLAVLSGGLSALVAALRMDLARRRRDAAPGQRSRLAACLVAEETTRLWVEHAAVLAEAQGDEAAANYVKLARVALDVACGDAIQLAQRSAGLAAFARPHPIERLCRDLATYMRQPTLDEVADEAAAYFLDHALPA